MAYTTMNQVIEIANKLIDDDFRNFVNKREFETDVTDIAESTDVKTIKKEEIDQTIENLLKHGNKELAFVLFFVSFTAYRRNKIGNILDFCNQYISNFLEYEITEHIKILAMYSNTANVNAYDTLIQRAEKLIAKNGSLFAEHRGIINLYAELICAYYERNLDLRGGDEDHALLEKALAKIDHIITIENYHKYHLNRGRLLILLDKCDEGESEILKAISLIKPDAEDRENRVRLYEQYLIKASFIRAYDLNDAKYRELEKIKVNNYKMVALMTTLLGFLLGAITIFTETRDSETLALLMLSFLSLILVLAGVVLLGLSISFKERKKELYRYDISLIGIGALLFIISMLIIIL